MNRPRSALRPEPVHRSRAIERLVCGQQVMDGAGVKISRVLTGALQRRLDPYLMLDAFRSDDPRDYLAGFPDHPHRGFETVTYMVAGRMRHRDSAGHEAVLHAGGVQWMRAARGVIHSEMPEQQDGTMEGFQLWLNLPARDKMSDPGYRDFAHTEIPKFDTAESVTVLVIAGASHGIEGAVRRPVTEPLFLDLQLPAGTEFAQTLPPGHNAFLYVYRGELTALGKRLAEGRMAILANSPDADGIIVQSSRPSRALLIAGRPLGEPIVQHGPFVMNTQDEIVAALKDFREGRFAT